MFYSMLHTKNVISKNERVQSLVKKINLIKLESLKFFTIGKTHSLKELIFMNYRMQEIVLNDSQAISGIYDEYRRYLNFYKDIDAA